MKDPMWVPARCFLIMGVLLWAPACDDPVEPNQGPATVGSIVAQSVFVADTVEIVVSGHFSDPDGDALSYSAQSSDPAVVSAAASAGTVRAIGLKQGTATVTVAATDPGGLAAEQSFTVTVPNRAPEAVDLIAAMETYVGESAHVVVPAYFSDPDGDSLSYTAESSDTRTVAATVSGDTVWVAGGTQGTAIVTVTATDGGGLSAEQSFTVTVPNRAPEAVDLIAAMETYVGESAHVVVPAYFSDPDGDSLSYTAESSDTGVVAATVSGDTVRVAGGTQGTATVTVTATDPGGLSAEQSFTVAVPNRDPEAVDSIAAMETFVGESAHVVVAAYFSDPDGDVLSYTAESSDTGVVSATVSGDTVWVAGGTQGTATVAVTATDPGGLFVTQNFTVTVPNRAPEAVDSIAAMEAFVGESAHMVVAAYFSEPDGDVLSYTAESSDTAVVSATVSGDTVWVAGGTQGTATVTVTATDPGGLSAEQSFTVAVPNRAPEAVDSIPALEKYLRETGAVVVSAYFTDPDGDALSYAVESSDTAVATAAASGDTVRVLAVARGNANITVNASDPEGLFAEQSFPFTVPNRPPEIVDSIPAVDTHSGDQITVIVSGYFSDPDGDSLGYDAESSDTGIATVSVSGESVRVVGVAEGSATVTVTASDPGGLSVAQAFPVKVRPDRQPAILEAFYEATGGANWTNNDNWLTDAPLDTWHGVEVNDQGRVTALVLHGNNLEGTILPELGGLSSLEKLQLFGNKLEGSIPAELGRLTNLNLLLLLGNKLSGSLPPELGNLSSVRWINLRDNELSGTIPPELGGLSKLRTLILRNNLLEGTVPPEMGDLQLLDVLDVNQNRLQGRFPSTLVKLEQLDKLLFSGNDRLCAPRNPAFSAWLTGVEDVDGQRCGDADRVVLEELYDVAGGPDWSESGGWLHAEDLGDWHGVKTDSFGYVVEIDLEDNGLRGTIPVEIGDIEWLTKLEIGTNDLAGPLPLRMINLSLERLGYADTELCELDDEEFREWLDEIPSLDGTGLECVDPRDVLATFYDATGGSLWTEDMNWRSDAPLDEWFGIETDDDGQVTSIELILNGLSGSLPPELTGLPRLERLRLDVNELTGPIPPELGKLASLRRLGLGGNRLTGTIPPELGGLTGLEVLWLTANSLEGTIPPELGELASLISLDLGSNSLTGAIPAELGKLANLKSTLDFGYNDLTGTIPPELGDLSKLRVLRLRGNRLSGPIPPELGKLANLVSLYLDGNKLTGTIPPELGDLHKLREMHLSNNRLAGSIPRALGDLLELKSLRLDSNRLTGSIPGKLGQLSRLSELDVTNNDLSGSLPAELGGLSSLRDLQLHGNDFSGALPAEFGSLDQLHALVVNSNPQLADPIPTSFTSLKKLNTLLASGTGLCAPDEATFLDWLEGIRNRRVKICGRDPSGAYLTQAVQHRDYPVPLVPGREALLRVFVTATRETDEEIPPVVARFYRNGSETYKVTIPGKSVVIPTEVDEGSLDKSSNASIPDTVLHPGLEMMVEIDPDSTLDEDLLTRKRIPEEGRHKFEVDSMPAFDLTVVPFLWEEDPDSSVLEWTEEMADEDEEHKLLHDSYDLLPVEGINVSEHAPVVSSSNNRILLLRELYTIRKTENGSGYWMGLMTGRVTGPANAYIGGKSSFPTLSSSTIAHELGHNLNNRHAPACSAPRADRGFPQPDGSIGAWGYNHRAEELVSPSTSDLMGYCRPRWISDYFFSKMVRYRVLEPEPPGVPSPGLLLWGGVDDEGVPSLEPAVVVDAPPSGPRGPGPYTLTGKDAAGARLFSFSFDMEEVADAEGEVAHFAFILPVEPGWAGSLVSITLTAPDGSATLDGETDAPMAIVRDTRSGQVRAFLRGLSERPAPPAGFEVYWSRGIPDREEWAR